MLAIAGAVLIHAACVLMAAALIKGDDTVTIYALTRILLAIGGGLMTADIMFRIQEAVKMARAERKAQE